MTKFIVIEKDSLNKATIDTAHISLNEASIIHTKMSRDDVAEFVRDGNNLVLKLKNGEFIVIEGFFITYDNVSSDLVFEEDGCVLYWFDGTSGFKGISGLEVLLPEAGSKLMGLLPWLVGAGVIGGVIAATDDDSDKKESIPNGTNTIVVDKNGSITGKTENIPEGTDVKITIIGKDKDGNLITHDETVKVDKDGNYTLDIPKEFVDGDLKVESEVVDRNGNTIKAEDSLEKTDHDNDPNTPDQGGLDRVDGAITAEIDPKAGTVSGTVTDVPEGEKVIVTIEGVDKDGNPVKEDVETTVVDGKYTVDIPAAIVDGSPVEADAKSTDNNGKPVTHTAILEGKTDHDNDPRTPDQGGLDRVDGSITVDIVESGLITGTTTDVAPNTDVVLTITGKDADGNDVTIIKTVQTDANGNYTAQLEMTDVDPVSGKPIVDGSAVNVEANTTDRNGQAVTPATDSIAAQGDNDNDPSTPEDTGLDLVDGSITVKVDNKGNITGGTTDVKPGSEVKLMITGQDKDGNLLVDSTVTAIVQPDGRYTALVPAGFADGDLTVKAETEDRNGKPVEAEDNLGTGKNNDPTTPGDESEGLDRVDGSITVDIVDTNSTQITGTTEDVAPNSKVTLEIISIDENGETRTFTEEVFTNVDGEYSYTLTPAQGNVTEVVAKVDDRNGNELQDSDRLDAVVKADPSTDINNGDNDVVGTSGNDVLAGDTGGLKTNFVAGHDYNVSIILDLSGSMYFGMDGTRPRDPNTGQVQNSPNKDGVLPDGMLSRLEIAKAGLKAFITQMADHDGVINLQISTFSSTGYVGNQSKWDKVFLDVTADNIDAIFEHIGSGKGGEGDGLTAGGGTNPELSFKEATDWFNSSEIKSNGYENQTYYITDGEPNTTQTTLDNAFKPLAEVSKVFAVGVSSSVSNDTVSRYDNTDLNGNKVTGTWSGTNHGTAQAIADADKLIAYLIGGSENFVPADVGNDVVKGGAGDDILFGDAMNTDWITGLDPLQYPKYSGYSKLIAHLKAEVPGGAEPTQQQIYDFVKANYQKFVTADATDTETKGGNDIIYGGSGNDIIIAGAGDDRIYGGSGDDIISTGRGDDTIVFDVLNAADATGGNGTDTWVDYETNDKIEFGADFFEGLLADKSNISEYIKVEDVNGKAVLKVDRDGAADATGGTTHDWADLLIIEGKTASELQDLINNQIIIG